MLLDVRGWCLGKDSLGAPTLTECGLMKGVEGKYFAQMNDREGNSITVRTYQRGETFFEDSQEALKEFNHRLDTERTRHYTVIEHLNKRQAEMIQKVGEEASHACRRPLR